MTSAKCWFSISPIYIFKKVAKKTVFAIRVIMIVIVVILVATAIVIVKVILVTCVIPVIEVGRMSIISYILTAVTALATGTTAVLAFFSLKNERDKKRLNVFSESIRVVMDGIKNSQSKEYILSNKYYKDIETVRYLLGKNKDEKISLVDFENIVVKGLIKDDINLSEEEKTESKERLRKSYKKIEYFCDRMEYLGILSEDKTVRPFILKYYDSTICDTYKRLGQLIIKTRKDRKKEELYEHYTRLYNLIKNINHN